MAGDQGLNPDSGADVDLDVDPSDLDPASLAAEGVPEGSAGSGIDCLPARVLRYGRARARALEMLAYLATLDQQPGMSPGSPLQPTQLRSKLEDCGNWLRFRHYLAVDEVRLTGASFCKEHLACALCAVRRGGKMLSAYLPKFDLIMAQRPGLVGQVVTVTVQNGVDLLSRFRHLRECWQALMRRRRQGDKVSSLRVAGFAGGVWSYEVTNVGNGWHPHLHALVLADRLVDALALRSEWYRLTRDSYIVDVRPLAGDPARAFCEVFKYAVKFSDLSPAERLEAFQTLRGARLIGSAGVFRGVQVPEDLTDSELEGEYMEYFYRYLHSAGVYSL
jgi:Replication protein